MSVERSAAKGFEQLSALAGAQPEEIRTRRRAAEDTYNAVLNRLGTAGTYDRPGAPTTDAEDIETSPGIWKTEKAKSMAATHGGAKGESRIKESAIADITRLDPEAYTKNLEKSSQFRIASRLTAEAEQLIAREGPLYDSMLRAQQLPIIEGNAAIARENAEALRRSAQRGGAGRRHAMEAVQKIRAQERTNRAKVTALSDTRFKLDVWARENARTQLEFNQNWASNLGGVRESFNAAMDQASALMVNSALPMMFNARKEATQYRMAIQNRAREKTRSIVMGVLAVASLAMGGVGALGLAGMGGAAGAALAPSAGALASTGLKLGAQAMAQPEAPGGGGYLRVGG